MLATAGWATSNNSTVSPTARIGSPNNSNFIHHLISTRHNNFSSASSKFYNSLPSQMHITQPKNQRKFRKMKSVEEILSSHWSPGGYSPTQKLC